jgi:hypothetical protein
MRAMVRRTAPRLLAWLLERRQYGVGAPAGAETLAEFAQRGFDSGAIVILIDRTNAYSRLDVTSAMAVLERLAPELIPIARALLVEVVVVGGTRSYVWRGIFMGCPLSPLLFALTLEAGLDAVRAEPGTTAEASTEFGCAGFLDDGIIIARNPRQAQLALGEVARADAACGQVIERSKCLILSRQADTSGITGIDARSAEGTRIVGVPVGTREFRGREGRVMVEHALQRRGELLRSGAMTAAARVMLTRASRGVPSFMHVLRSLPLAASDALASEIDASRDKWLSEEMAMQQLRQLPLAPVIGLPRRYGGLALYAARDLAPAAFLAGRLQADRLLRASGPSGAASLPAMLALPSGRPDVRHITHGVDARCACLMPVHSGCALRRCVCCCVLARDGGCVQCTSEADASLARFNAEVAPLRGDGERALAALAERVWLAGHPRTSFPPVGPEHARHMLAARRAAAAASRFAQPQRPLTQALFSRMREELQERLRSAGDARSLQVIDASADIGARALWDAVPVSVEKFFLSDSVIRTALRLWLGVPVLPPQARGVCVTSTVAACKPCPVDRCSGADDWAADRHALCCKRGGLPQAIHDLIVERISRACTELGFGVEEPVAQGWLPPSSRLKVDFAVRGAGAMGSTLIVDVTRRCVDPGVAATGVLARADASKYQKYANQLFRPATLSAFALDHRGRLSPAAKRVIQLIAAAAARRSGAHIDDVRAMLLQRVAVALYHGTAFAFARTAEAALCSHYPGVPQLEDLRVRGRLAFTLPASRRAELHACSPPIYRAPFVPWL